jgi:hypothetical protein
VFSGDHVGAETMAMARAAVAAAHDLGDPLLESAALDALSAIHLARGDVPAAVGDVDRRLQLVAGVRPAADNGLEITDAYFMAAEIALAAGDFATARRAADTLVSLPFHSEEGHLATSRRMKVDALAGDIARVLADAERFRRGWLQAGRPVASGLGGGTYAVAMVHGLRGDDDARAEWVDITIGLGVDFSRLAACSTGYGPTFDAIVALHRGDVATALDRLQDHPAGFADWHTGEWRPWYAALWAEAAVLGGTDDATRRLVDARPMVAANRTAAAMVERAEALAAGDTGKLATLAEMLAGTGCRYQWARTLILAGGDHAVEGRRAMADLGAAPMVEPEPA